MNRIEWTHTAEDDYLALLRDTYSNSTDNGIALFERIENLMNQLREFKYLCPKTRQFPKFRRCVVTRTLSIVYEVGLDSITIVSIFDNRQESPFL